MSYCNSDNEPANVLVTNFNIISLKTFNKMAANWFFSKILNTIFFAAMKTQA